MTLLPYKTCLLAFALFVAAQVAYCAPRASLTIVKPPTAEDIAFVVPDAVETSAHRRAASLAVPRASSSDSEDDYTYEEDEGNSPRTLRCPLATTRYWADQYLLRQPLSPAGWYASPSFIDQLADDVILTTNAIVGEVAASGKPAVIDVLNGIGTLYQVLPYIVSGPTNFYRRNAVFAKFEKGQRSIALGITYNISFVHEITFNNNCKITAIREFADVSKTELSLPDLVGHPIVWPCIAFEERCSGVNVSFGPAIDSLPSTVTPAGRCFLWWYQAPEQVRDTPDRFSSVQLGRSAAVVPNSYSRFCLSNYLTVLRNLQNQGVDQRAALCPLIGAPIAGRNDGCWLTSAA